MFREENLKNKIENALEGAIVEVKNPRQDGRHFLVSVTWKGFKELKLIKQHQKINEILSEELKAGLHSLSIKTKSQ